MDTLHLIAWLVILVGTLAAIAAYVYTAHNGPRWAHERDARLAATHTPIA